MADDWKDRLSNILESHIADLKKQATYDGDDKVLLSIKQIAIESLPNYEKGIKDLKEL